MTPNVFESDAFELSTLIAAINEPVEGQHVPDPLDALFNEEPISTTTAWIEMQGDTLALVPAGVYGSPGDPTRLDRRKGKSLDLIHLPTTGAVLAAEVQGVRAFGSDNTAQVVETKRDQVLAKMRRRIEATRRYHRIKSLQGQILDADGSTVLLDIFAFFGVTQQTKSLVLGTATTKVKAKLEEAKELAEDAVGGSASIMGWRCYAGRSFFNDLVSHDAVEQAYGRWNDGAVLRESQANRPFSFIDIDFHKYYGNVGGKLFIPTNEAYLVPVLDDPDGYITRNGPADYLDTVNTMGLPFYSSAELMDHNKGVSLEAQANTISLPTRPRSIIKLTK